MKVVSIWGSWLFITMFATAVIASDKDQKTLEKPAYKKPLGLEAKFLMRANNALLAGRLFPNQGLDNAFDQFQSVLQLNPNSVAAKSGLSQITLKSAEKVRTLLKSGSVNGAERALERYQAYLGKNPVFDDLQKQIRQSRAPKKTAAVKPSPDAQGLAVIILDQAQLSKKGDQIKQQLNSIATRIKDSGESIMIYARNDSEGRWLYKEIKKASGMLVRGDIRISKKARIEFLPPL